MQKNFTSALARYTTQLAKYPYIEDGWDLPEQSQPTFYFLCRFRQENFDSDVIRDLQVGFLTTQRHNNHELYENALADLGADALLSSHIIAVDRSAEDFAYIPKRSSSPSLPSYTFYEVTLPLRSVRSVRQQRILHWSPSQYRHPRQRPDNVGADTLYNLPTLPGIYGPSQTGVPGLISVKYGSATGLPDDQVMADIISKVKLMYPASTPAFAVFSSHTPFELTVPASAINAWFYKKLYRLQGYRKTWYTGAAFHTHDSSLLWQFTEKLLPSIAA
ncbi:hypothetical protein V1527DRAFT_485538 [Lipomyces starkeyi]